MKKIIALAISVLFFITHCFGQGGDTSKTAKKHSFAVTGGYGRIKKPDTTKNDKRFSFGVNDGYGIPLGTLRATDISKYPVSRVSNQDTSHLSGYGKYGFHYEYFVSYRILKHLSIVLSIGGNDLGFNISTLNSQFCYNLYPNNPNKGAVTTGDSYYTLQYLAGANYNFPLNKFFRIELRALGGQISTNYPDLSYIGLFNESEIYQFSQGKGFGYDIGAGIKAITAEGYIGVHLNINYIGSNVTFPSYSVAYFTPPDPLNPAISNQYINSATFNSPKTMAISILQITLGVSAEL